MLQRISEAARGSFDKIFNASSNGTKTIDVLYVSSDSDSADDEELENCKDAKNTKLMKSKSRWNVQVKFGSSDRVREEHSNSAAGSVATDSDNENDEHCDYNMLVDLTTISVSDCPSIETYEEDQLQFMMDGTKYFENLEILQSDPKNQALILWKTFDFNSIPLRVDDIQYWNDIYRHMKIQELTGHRVLRTALLRHPDLTIFMRSKLINWLFEVVLHFRLQRSTLYLTQIFVDTFLSVAQGQSRREFQLLGLAALLLAAKSEEIRPPSLTDLSQICDGAFLEAQIAGFELKLCSALKWRLLSPPNAFKWLEMYLNHMTMFMAARDVNEIRLASIKLLDLAIHSAAWLNFRPSALAATAFFLNYSPHRRDLDQFSLCTGYQPFRLESEIRWMRGYQRCRASIAFLDPKGALDDIAFEALLKENSLALSFVHKEMAWEDVEAFPDDGTFF